MKNMIGKTSFLNHESLCHPVKIFKLLNKRKEQSNKARKTAVIFRKVFLKNARCNCVFIRNNKSLKLMG